MKQFNHKFGQAVRIDGIGEKAARRKPKPVSDTVLAGMAATQRDEYLDWPGWNIGPEHGGRTGKGGYQDVHIDENQDGKSLAMKYRLGTQRINRKSKIRARIRNRAKRDLSDYSGIRFSIKSAGDIELSFILADSEEGLYEEEIWFYIFPVTTDWREIRIPFESLALHRRRADRLGTNRILELDRTEQIAWAIDERNAELGTEGVIWIDDISFIPGQNMP